MNTQPNNSEAGVSSVAQFRRMDPPPTRRKLSFWAGCGLVVGGLSILCVLGGILVSLLSINSLRAFGSMILGAGSYSNGKNEQAIQLYNQSLELKPESRWHPFIYLMRGLAYSDNREYQRALNDYSRAIQHDPLNAMAYINRGLANLELNNPEHAMDDFNQALELQPEYTAGIYWGRGFVYLQQANFKKALAEFDRVLLEYPQDPEINAYIFMKHRMYGVPELWYFYFVRGNIKSQQSDYKRAILDYNKSIELVPIYSMSWNNRCWSYFMLGEHEQALPDCEKALQLDPNNIEALDSRARVFKSLGRKEEAIADFKRIIELGTNSSLSIQAAAELRKLETPIGLPKTTPTPLPTQ